MCSKSEPHFSRLPAALYRAEAVRALDRYAIQTCGIPGFTLMQRAGAAAFDVLRSLWPGAQHLTVLCGMGNNGGDGYVLARLAAAAGLAVRVMSIGDPARLCGDAALACQALAEQGITVAPFDETMESTDVVVDALLGTGLDRKIEGRVGDAIRWINRSGASVLAIDIPSGLHADTGCTVGDAVRAEATVSFIGLKQGLFTGQGPDCCGWVYYHSLDVPPEVFSAATPAATRIQLEDFKSTLQPRHRSSHKGDFGHVLVVGGDVGFVGAARMAAEAAARVGAGLVSVATRAAHASIVNVTRPELMCHGVEEAGQLRALMTKAEVIAIGPGLGRSPWAHALLAAALEGRWPLVVDADALNLIAAEPSERQNWILTPHPGEAARLLGAQTQDIQRDRFNAALAIQARYGGVCVLKGTGTVVTDGVNRPAVCAHGNPGMASGGMGDVLTGVIAGFLAQGMEVSTAAKAGVCVHAGAGDRAAQEGERGLLACDLMPWLRRLVNPQSGVS
ncbi:MAG: NAD(P)H-hydrate dehydratase [Gammaproteobacteria bacterium]